MTLDDKKGDFGEAFLRLARSKQGWKEVTKIKEEMDSWRPFWLSLRTEERELFRQLSSEVWHYSEAIEHAEREDTTDSFLMSLVLSQQKIIDKITSDIKVIEELIRKRDE